MTALQIHTRQFPLPIFQSAVGHAPAGYIAHATTLIGGQTLQDKAREIINDTSHPWRKQICRETLGATCRDNRIDPIIAFSCCMAWGNQCSTPGGYDNFVAAIRDNVRLTSEIERLRQGEDTREAAFKRLSTTGKIEGLGFSFFTKLIYFFMPVDSRGYILDQHSARAAQHHAPAVGIKLSGNGHPRTMQAGVYEKYCRLIEEISEGRGAPWTTDLVEVSLFTRGKTLLKEK
jgi:hypothetical protein